MSQGLEKLRRALEEARAASLEAGSERERLLMTHQATVTQLQAHTNHLRELLRAAERSRDSAIQDAQDHFREFTRYKQALTTANGFLIMNSLEPVKLEYGEKSS